MLFPESRIMVIAFIALVDLEAATANVPVRAEVEQKHICTDILNTLHYVALRLWRPLVIRRCFGFVLVG